MRPNQAVFLLQVTLWALWPFTAYAAQASFARSFYEADMLLDILLTFGISLLVGAAALLTYIKNEYKAQRTVDKIWLVVVQKLMVSQVAGFLMWLLADMWHMPRSATGMTIIAAAWLGDIFIDKIAERWGGTAASKIT